MLWGMIGALLFSGLHVLFEASGAKVVAWVIFFIGLILVTGKALVPYLAEKHQIYLANGKKHRDKKKYTEKAK